MTAPRAKKRSWLDVPAPPAEYYKPECWLSVEHDAPAWPFIVVFAALLIAGTYL